MKTATIDIPGLRKKLDKVLKAPPSFDLFVAIHDFVEEFESGGFSAAVVPPAKYQYLRQIHRGVKDTLGDPQGDLGHDRYMVIQELRRIRKNEASDGNSLWKRRDVFRSISAEVYKLLTVSAAKEE